MSDRGFATLSPAAPDTGGGAWVAKADLQLGAAALLAGSGWLFSMKALAAFPPLFFMGSRFVIAGML